jgi:hypothetical protein
MKLIQIYEDIYNETEMEELYNEILERLEEIVVDEPLFKNVIKYFKEKDYQKTLDEYRKHELQYSYGNTYDKIYKIRKLSSLQTRFDKSWGSKSGTYIAYRAGDIKKQKNGLFFSIDEIGAKSYSDTNRPVQKYEVTIRNPYTSKMMINLISELGEVPIQKIYNKRDKMDSGKFTFWADEQAVKLATKKGYDSILYTDPLPPADIELVVFNPNNVKLME